MGVCICLTTLSDAHIERVLLDPPLVELVVHADEPEAYERARNEQPKPSLLHRLFHRRPANAPVPEPFSFEESEVITVDLDKSWHGIHYLLTGTAEEGDFPSAFLLAGGRQVGTIDVGYGPARAFSAAEAREVFSALSALSEDALRKRFNPSEMTALAIYPEIWSRGDPEEETLGYLFEYFETLRGFFQQATEEQMGVLVWAT